MTLAACRQQALLEDGSLEGGPRTAGTDIAPRRSNHFRITAKLEAPIPCRIRELGNLGAIFQGASTGKSASNKSRIDDLMSQEARDQVNRRACRSMELADKVLKMPREHGTKSGEASSDQGPQGLMVPSARNRVHQAPLVIEPSWFQVGSMTRFMVSPCSSVFQVSWRPTSSRKIGTRPFMDLHDKAIKEICRQRKKGTLEAGHPCSLRPRVQVRVMPSAAMWLGFLVPSRQCSKSQGQHWKTGELLRHCPGERVPRCQETL